MAELQCVRVDLPHDHPSFAGHFPGRPLLPGVVLLSQVLEVLMADAATAAWLTPAPMLNLVKFLAPVEPGAALDVRWTPPVAGARLRFEVWRHAPGDAAEGVLAASGQLDAGAATS
jgi:3-hydroxymyristoyl/3-hydroxydecanoyl-(acyl carrier protein) dehydratase